MRCSWCSRLISSSKNILIISIFQYKGRQHKVKARYLGENFLMDEKLFAGMKTKLEEVLTRDLMTSKKVEDSTESEKRNARGDEDPVAYIAKGNVSGLWPQAVWLAIGKSGTFGREYNKKRFQRISGMNEMFFNDQTCLKYVCFSPAWMSHVAIQIGKALRGTDLTADDEEVLQNRLTEIENKICSNSHNTRTQSMLEELQKSLKLSRKKVDLSSKVARKYITDANSAGECHNLRGHVRH